MTEPTSGMNEELREMLARIQSERNRGEASRAADFHTVESIRAKSQMTEEDAAAIADEIDRAAWQRVRRHYESE
jgi:hypothetical protein